MIVTVRVTRIQADVYEAQLATKQGLFRVAGPAASPAAFWRGCERFFRMAARPELRDGVDRMEPVFDAACYPEKEGPRLGPRRKPGIAAGATHTKSGRLRAKAW